MTAGPIATADVLSSRILSEGRWANSVLHLVETNDGPWVIKDFSSRSFAVRNTIGALLIRRELTALQRCAGIPGIPADVHRAGRYALAYRFLPGEQVREAPDEMLSPAVFEGLEATVIAIHKRGIVHNDLRNARNLLVDETGASAVIDFQAYLDCRHIPRFLRRLLQEADISGIYKHWDRRLPDTLDAKRRERLERSNRWRKLWIFRGYLGVRPEESPENLEKE